MISEIKGSIAFYFAVEPKLRYIYFWFGVFLLREGEVSR